MNVDQLLRFLDDQAEAIQLLAKQLEEVQVAFNARFDEFKSQHDALLDDLTDQVLGGGSPQAIAGMGAISPGLRRAIEERLPEEQRRIDERRRKIREEYLPQRRRAADALLETAQAELAKLRALNPALDEREEELKSQKAQLEARLAELNREIRQKSRGLGLVRHFLAITEADRERQRVLGRLEAINESLASVRQEWQRERERVERDQAGYEEQWQLESIAVARLQSELDQLDDQAWSADLALRRAVRFVLDNLKEPSPSPDPALDARLQEMVDLNIQTDAYHEGLASVGGLIALSGGIRSGLQAVGQSIDGLKREQQMHKAYLKPLEFSLPPRVAAFHKQWPALAKQFADEKTVGAHPAEFAAAVKPLLDGQLSQASIEGMFNDLGVMIKQATAGW